MCFGRLAYSTAYTYSPSVVSCPEEVQTDNQGSLRVWQAVESNCRLQGHDRAIRPTLKALSGALLASQGGLYGPRGRPSCSCWASRHRLSQSLQREHAVQLELQHLHRCCVVSLHYVVRSCASVQVQQQDQDNPCYPRDSQRQSEQAHMHQCVIFATQVMHELPMLEQ